MAKSEFSGHGQGRIQGGGNVTRILVSTVELVRLQRMLEVVRENPIEQHAKLAQAHELIDSWLIDPKRQVPTP